MKKYPPLFFALALFLVPASYLYADSTEKHIARDGDRLHPGLSLSSYLILSISDSSRTVLLDPKAVSFDDSQDAAAYIDGDTISYVQSATKHRFILHADTISYIGFENRATDFRLDSSVSVAHFPLKDGDIVRDSWTGHVFHHGSMLLKRMTGVSTSRVETGWKLTDGTDTLRNATRLVWTLDMAYADTDSLDTSLPDSITSGLISDMQVEARDLLSERMVTGRSLWFTEDARYPVLTDSRVSRVITTVGAGKADTVPISMLSMYYPSSFQYSDTGELPPEKPTRANSGSEGSQCNEFGDETAPGLLTVGEPYVMDHTISITLSNKGGAAEATLTIFSDSGIRLAEPSAVTIGVVPQKYKVNIPAGWQGIILLRVDAGNESYTLNVII